MKKEEIFKLVKELESFFIGYTALGDRLKNSNGMELVFRLDWKGQTRVVGLHASQGHSIGCSFKKPVEKIVKDISRRLIPDYFDDFFLTKRENKERAEFEESEKLKLMAIADAINGQISHDNGHRHVGGPEYIQANNTSIYRAYNGRYEVQLNLSFSDTLKIASFLKSFTLVDLNSVEIKI